MLEWIILFPVLASLACLLFERKPAWAEKTALAGVFLSLLTLVLVASGFSAGKTVTAFFGLLTLDAVSLLFTFLTAVVSLFVFMYSIGYLRREVLEGVIEQSRLSRYYALLSVFLATMFLATLASNLLVIWAAVEATTLTSVFLISFYNRKESIEAAWKYFIICSLGITVALIGIIILGYGFASLGLTAEFTWSAFAAMAAGINPFFLKIAFAFMLVGYGTKMGLVPLHVWLPDAHSQAPTPVSALLSGVLLNVALYAILRAYQIVSPNLEAAHFASALLVFFGLLTLGLASLRLYFQENVKRLLAYSSVENMGIVALAAGIGGPLGFMAALLHVTAHSLVKPLAFFIGGILSLNYETKDIRFIRGAARAVPVFGLLFVLVALGVAGSLPFGTFFSEVALLAAALSSGQSIAALLLVVFASIAFGSLLLKSTSMAFGEPTGGVRRWHPHESMTYAVFGLLGLAVIFGLFMPEPFLSVIQSAAASLSGG